MSQQTESFPDEYTIELYENDGTWVKQLLRTIDIDEFDRYYEEHEPDDGYYFSPWCIVYDQTTGEIKESYPMY